MSLPALNDASHLTYTQELRRTLVGQYMADGKFPSDPDMIKILLSALKDYDRVSLTLKRLDSENENADADRQALAQFYKLSSMTGAKDYFQDTPASETSDEEHSALTPPGFNPEEIPAVELVNGELRRGHDSVDFESFMAEQDKKRKESLA